MTRSTTGTLLRRRRDGRPARAAEPHKVHAPAPGVDPASGRTSTITAARIARRLDLPQDSATYACRCGYVFEAAVSTSVGCPYCGDSQAW